MKRIILILAIMATQADGQSSATACYIAGSSTACYKPVNTASMAGPASATVSGYLSSTDWAAFNTGGAGGVPATRTISTTAPLGGGGDLSANRTLTITQAATAANGYLSSTDWNTFNGKLTSPLTTQGDILYEDGTPAPARLARGTATQLLHSGTTPSWSAVSLTADVTGVLPVGNMAGPAATATSGYLSSTDWNTFNSKQATITQGNLTETTSSVLSIVGGTSAVIGSGTTIAVTKSDTTHNGYVSSTDWVTFNNKVSTTRAINTTAPITGGGDLSADRTIAISAASTSAAGSVSFEGSTTATPSITGPRTVTSSIHCTRAGSNVTCNFAADTGTSCSVATSFSATAGIPSGYRPAIAVESEVKVQNSGTSGAGLLTVTSGGNIIIENGAGGGNFTGSGNCGWGAMTISYSAN